MNIIRYKTTAQKCDVSVITIRRWATLPEYSAMRFPKPVRLGESSVGFIEEEVEAFLAERAAKRGGAPQ